MPLTVTIKEKGVFKTEFTIGQANMEGYSDSSFNYTAEIRNRTAEKQHYALDCDSSPRLMSASGLMAIMSHHSVWIQMKERELIFMSSPL